MKTRVYQGKPCIHGHSGKRYVSNGKCIECIRKGKQHVWVRKQALAAGERFYQGKPCPHGHSGKRYSYNCACVECLSAEHQRNLEYHRLYDRARYAKMRNNPEYLRECREKKQRWRARNPEQDRMIDLHARAVNRNTLIALREMGVLI